MHASHVLALMYHPCIYVLQRMASNNQYTLPTQSSLQKTRSAKFQLRSKHSSNVSFPEQYLTILVAVSNATHIALQC